MLDTTRVIIQISKQRDQIDCKTCDLPLEDAAFFSSRNLTKLLNHIYNSRSQNLMQYNVNEKVKRK